MSVLERLARNLQYAAYARIVRVLSGFLLTPFILKHVDLRIYGLNALIISIVGYFNILDFGLNSGISRFAAKFFGEKRYKEISDILYFGIKFFVGLGLLVAGVLFTLSFCYEKVFQVDVSTINQGRLLFRIYAISSFFIWSVIPFRGIIIGFQRNDVIDKIGLCISLLNIPIVLVVLTQTGSYITYIGLLQLATVILTCMNILFVIHLLPHFRFQFSKLSPGLRNELLAFSGWRFIGGIFGLIVFEIDHLVIGTILGLNAVAIYSISMSFQDHIRGLNSLVGSPFFSVITAEFARNDKKAKDFLVMQTTRMHSGILIPIIIITLLSVDDFIIAWVGDRFVDAILPCQVLLSYWFFNISIDILSQAVIGGLGIAFATVKIGGFLAFANLGLSLLLIQFMGITGVALGTAIPNIIASSYYTYRFCRVLTIPVREYLLRTVLPNIPHFLLALVLTVLFQGFMKTGNVFQIATIMVAIYTISLLFGYSLLSQENKRIIKEIIVLRV